MTPEQIAKLFQDMEEDLFRSMARNLQAHEEWEEDEGFQWEQWQAMQIKGLRKYREEIQGIVNHTYKKAKPEMEKLLKEAYHKAGKDSMEWLKRYSTHKYSQKFFGVPPSMTTLLNDVLNDVEQTRYAAINRMNTGYVNTIQKADIMMQSGSYTLPQAVDMAAKDFVSAGLNCVEYRNGARVGIDSYLEMALRTSAYESARIAEGVKRDEWGEHLVISNVINTTCPACARWQGRVLIDDVYSNGKPDGKHLRLSVAKANKFLHPNCRHKPRTYIEGITEIPKQPDKVKNKEQYNAEQKQRYYERNIRKYKRLRDCALDDENKAKYQGKVKEWSKALDEHLEQNPYLKKDPWRTSSRGTNGRSSAPEVKEQRRTNSGALDGALNSRNDPKGERRKAHAERYYKSVLNRDKELEVKTIARNANFKEEEIKTVYEHVFENTHKYRYQDEGKFIPSYDMSLSWSRLRAGNPEEHDIIMLHHELEEAKIMRSGDVFYEDAHAEVNKKWNYSKALKEYKKRNNIE